MPSWIWIRIFFLLGCGSGPVVTGSETPGVSLQRVVISVRISCSFHAIFLRKLANVRYRPTDSITFAINSFLLKQISMEKKSKIRVKFDRHIYMIDFFQSPESNDIICLVHVFPGFCIICSGSNGHPQLSQSKVERLSCGVIVEV